MSCKMLKGTGSSDYNPVPNRGSAVLLQLQDLHVDGHLLTPDKHWRLELALEMITSEVFLGSDVDSELT